MDASRQAIVDAASDWFVRARDGELTQKERGQLARWLKASPVHVSEYLAVARLWGDVSALDDATLTIPELTPADIDTNVVELADRVEARSTEQATRGKQRWAALRRTGTARIRVVAGWLLAATVLGTLGWWQVKDTTPIQATARGEQRSLVLEDGTVIEMNTSSEVRVGYDSAARIVTLVQGEVYFDVWEDAERPFIVRAGESEIRVHGTKFNVYMQMQATTVTVLEGNVTVSTGLSLDNGASGPEAGEGASRSSGVASVELVGGEEAVIDNNTRRITTAAIENMEQAVAWTDRRLIFDESRLDQILAEFARYNDFSYAISGEDVGTLMFTGVFDTQDPESFISYLEYHSEVSVSRENGVIVVGSPR